MNGCRGGREGGMDGWMEGHSGGIEKHFLWERYHLRLHQILLLYYKLVAVKFVAIYS